MSKFQRKFQLTVKDENDQAIVITNPLTMTFNIVRHDLSSASAANIKVYNLGLQNRNRILKYYEIMAYKKMTVELRAGYEGMMPVIFKGDVLEARSYRMEGSVNFMTEIEAQDGGYDIAHSDSNFGVAAGSLRRDAIIRMAKDFKNCKVGAIGNFPGTYARQRVFAGKTSQHVIDETGGNFFIDNNHVYCLKNDEAIEGEVLVVISETGLLGSPMVCERYLQAEMLFEPRLKIGQLVEIISRDNPVLNQIYKVVGLTHIGTISDAVGGKCKTHIRMLYGQYQTVAMAGG